MATFTPVEWKPSPRENSDTTGGGDASSMRLKKSPFDISPALLANQKHSGPRVRFEEALSDLLEARIWPRRDSLCDGLFSTVIICKRSYYEFAWKNVSGVHQLYV
jgi:hypothetical protein